MNTIIYKEDEKGISTIEVLEERVESCCLICGNYCINCEILIDGTVYHKRCYTKLKDEELTLANQIDEIDHQISQINSQIFKSHSKINQIKNWITRKEIDVSSLINQLEKFEDHHQKLVIQRNNCKSILDKLYCYWPSYPPDGENRKSEIYAGKFTDVCEECGLWKEPLHVHHIIPISKGGDHRLNNLILLCEKCHSKRHGNREFSYSNNNEASYFSKRVQLLKHAIETNKIVHFHYRKFHGQRSVRSIKPSGIKQVGQSLCVEGFCYLRNADRIFAIKRMKLVKIVKSPGKGREFLK
jgi:hypothetical protein